MVFIIPAFTQGTVGSSRPLLRMERAQPGELACLLVREDGSYRLEKMFRAKTDVFNGAPASLQVDRLRAMLDNDKLANLSQANIHQPLITDTIDDIQLAIWRGQAWQQLTFASPESRKPFQEFMNPLLQWFHDVQKQRPGTTRSDEAPTRCMPSRPQQEVVISGEPATSASVSGPTNGYLFRFESSHAYKWAAESACTLVFTDGRFRRERGNQEYMGKRRGKVADGQLDPNAIRQLIELLNSSELRQAASIDDPGKDTQIAMQEGRGTVVKIPREGNVQILHFLAAFNTKGKPHEPVGMSNLGYRTADQAAIEPLLRWMKQNTEKRAHEIERDGVGNDCSPETTTAASKPDNH